MKFIFSPDAVKDFQKINSPLQEQILEKIYWFEKQESPFHFSKILVNKVPKTYRFRVKDYRILGEYHAEENEFLISKIGHRKDIYKD